MDTTSDINNNISPCDIHTAAIFSFIQIFYGNRGSNSNFQLRIYSSKTLFKFIGFSMKMLHDSLSQTHRLRQVDVFLVILHLSSTSIFHIYVSMISVMDTAKLCTRFFIEPLAVCFMQDPECTKS